MKKWIAMGLALALAVCLTACGGKADPESQPESQPESVAEESASGGETTTPSESAGEQTAVPGETTTAAPGGKTTATTTTGKAITTTAAGEVSWGDLFGDDTTAAKTTATAAKTQPGQPTATTTTAAKVTTTKPAVTTTKTTLTTATKTTKVSGVKLPAEGFSLDGRIVLKNLTLKGSELSIDVFNATKGFETDQDGAAIIYRCLNDKGKVLKNGSVPFGRIHAQNTTTVTVTLPANTAEFEVTSIKADFWTDGFR